MNERDLNPGGTRFAEARADDVDRRFPFHLRFLIQRNVGHFLSCIKEGVFHHFCGDVLEGSKDDDEKKGRGSQPLLIQKESQEDEASCADHDGRDLCAETPAEAANEKTAEKESDDEGADSDGGAYCSHKGLIGACFRVGELEVGFPSDFSEVDGKSIGDNHDRDITKVRRAYDEFKAVEKR